VLKWSQLGEPLGIVQLVELGNLELKRVELVFYLDEFLVLSEVFAEQGIVRGAVHLAD